MHSGSTKKNLLRQIKIRSSECMEADLLISGSHAVAAAHTAARTMFLKTGIFRTPFKR